AQNAARSLESRGGWVRTDEDYTALLTEPLTTLLEKAEALSGRASELLVENDPFAGLSAKKPIRALSALSVEAKKQHYPEWAWGTFLNSKARESDRPKLSGLIAARVRQLPESIVTGVIHPI